jgi:hypothetical protein
MACVAGTDKFYIEANGINTISANDQTKDVCTATKILDRLHREFTEQYVTGTAAAGKTLSSTAVQMNPTFYLRKQPKLNGFQGEDTTADDIYRLNKYLTTTGANDQNYRSAVHAVMNGVYNATITGTDYLNELTPTRDLENANNFKGIYGLKKLNEVLEQKITEKVNSMAAKTGDSKLLSEAQHYETRQNIKTTLQEIARRENEIYREKFLHIILVVLGIFLVSSQLVQKYFSLGSSSGTSGGFGFGSGNLFTGFGLGTGSGLFSRFGGLGLGRSGRSRITSMFSNNPYSLSNR